jgi:hypothetical protein
MKIAPTEFWLMTIAEFVELTDDHKKQMLSQRNDLIYTAWHVAAFMRAKPLPDLKDVLITEAPAKHQTDDQMLAKARVLNMLFGGVEVEA